MSRCRKYKPVQRLQVVDATKPFQYEFNFCCTHQLAYHDLKPHQERKGPLACAGRTEHCLLDLEQVEE